jgi:hypothetical protein
MNNETQANQSCTKNITINPTPVPGIQIDKIDANPNDRDGNM